MKFTLRLHSSVRRLEWIRMVWRAPAVERTEDMIEVVCSMKINIDRQGAKLHRKVLRVSITIFQSFYYLPHDISAFNQTYTMHHSCEITTTLLSKCCLLSPTYWSTASVTSHQTRTQNELPIATLQQHLRQSNRLIGWQAFRNWDILRISTVSAINFASRPEISTN